MNLVAHSYQILFSTSSEKVVVFKCSLNTYFYKKLILTTFIDIFVIVFRDRVHVSVTVVSFCTVTLKRLILLDNT